MVRIFKDIYGTKATLKQLSDGTWYVDMGCVLWNRLYKSEKWALNYLLKNGFKEV